MTDNPEFKVSLDVFSGPFSVLLDLVSKRNLDLTEVALGQVTDEFIAFIRQQDEFDLSAASEFLVVAATLLDLKIARLLPREESEEEDWELIEQRDLLFAKLLQYRAYKDVAADFAVRLENSGKAVGRDVPLEEPYASSVPPAKLTLTVQELAMLAMQALLRQPEEPVVEITHLHDPVVAVASQVNFLERRLAHVGESTFAELCEDAPNSPTVVSRFLAVLELIRRRAVAVYQSAPLEALVIRATPEEDTGSPLSGEFDDAAATAPDTEAGKDQE